MENENISFEEFETAFETDADNQIGTEEETVEEETTEPETETTSEATEEEQQEDSDDKKEPADAQKESQEETKAEEVFTLKVNKEEKNYSREEVISLAQKGADYDRVKEQLLQSRVQIESQKEAMEVLADLAKDSGMEMPNLLNALRINLLKKQGLSDDAANERLLRMKAEKENETLKAAATQAQKESSTDRANREVSEFRENYPDVELTKELIDKLMPDVSGGKSLTTAYHNLEKAQAESKIAELERKLAAQKQNEENKSSSPGSQKDSGGRRTKSEYDDFLEAFN